MEDKKDGGVTVTLLNRGQRSYEVAGTEPGKTRRHAPGATMDYTAEEAGKLGMYKELVDITKLPGQIDAAKTKADNAKLLADNAALKAQLEALTPKKEETAELETVPAETRRKKDK